MKIILGPSKTFNLSNSANVKAPRPIFLNKAREIFKFIKGFDLETTQSFYKLSSKKTLEVFDMHKHHGEQLYYAIEMYNGYVYKQLELEKYDKEWVNEHVVIIDALYGIIKPYDLIAPYRFYFDLRPKFIDLKKFWIQDLNDYLRDETEIINLASKEYSSLIKHKLNTPTFTGSTMAIKKARGQRLNSLILENQK